MLFGLLLFTSLSFIKAQNSTDAEGCKDHPLLTRMPEYFITECWQRFDQLDFVNAAGEDRKLQ